MKISCNEVVFTLKEFREMRGLIFHALNIDGSHHKQYDVYKVAELLGMSRKLELMDVDKGIPS